MSKAEKCIFVLINTEIGHHNIPRPRGNKKGGGEDSQDMLENQTMQDTLNQHLRYFWNILPAELAIT